MKKEERNERVSGWWHEMLKRDVNNVRVYVDGLSTCVNYGRKGDILDEITSLQKYLRLMKKAVQDGTDTEKQMFHLSH